jgi:protein CpxP
MISKRSFYWILSLMLAMPLLALRAPAAQDQGGPGRGPGGGFARRGPMSPDDRLKQMTKDFDLTSDQQAKIKPILVDERQKLEGMRNDSSGDWQARRSKMMQFQKDANTQIRDLLDDKQKEKFDKQLQDREQRGPNRRGGPAGPGGPGGPGGQGGPGGPGGPPQN